MIEFKFSCPNCSQHIQCNDAYSGMQIICPTCKNQIVVPQAPGSIPAKPPVATPPSPSVQSQTAATKSPVSSGPKRKYQPRWGMICGAGAVLVFIGVIAYTFFSTAFSRSETATRTTVAKPAVRETVERAKSDVAPSRAEQVSAAAVTSKASQDVNDSRTPVASEIVRQVIENHERLTSYSAKGKAVSIIDMSGVDPSNIPGAGTAEMAKAANAEEFKKAISKPQRMESDFSIKLGKPDFYRIEWEGMMGPINRKGAVWSSGDGDFLLTEMGQIKYSKMKSRELALASATGISGGVANTMPQIFFQGQSSLLNLFKNATRGDDETINSEECYVVTGSAMGMKIHLWISKSNYLIKQKQQVLGGNLEIPEMSDANMEEGLKQLGGEPSEKQKAQMKETMKNVKALTSQMKGTMTETYEDIQINQPATKTDFDYKVPAGIKLSSSPF